MPLRCRSMRFSSQSWSTPERFCFDEANSPSASFMRYHAAQITNPHRNINALWRSMRLSMVAIGRFLSVRRWMKQRRKQICFTTAELALHYGGLGARSPNKRSAGSKTIALLANANCYTSALLANMFLDQHNNGRRRAEAFVNPSAQKQEQKKNIPKNGLRYNVPHQTNWTEKFPSSVARRWESS